MLLQWRYAALDTIVLGLYAAFLVMFALQLDHGWQWSAPFEVCTARVMQSILLFVSTKFLRWPVAALFPFPWLDVGRGTVRSSAHGRGPQHPSRLGGVVPLHWHRCQHGEPVRPNRHLEGLEAAIFNPGTIHEGMPTPFASLAMCFMSLCLNRRDHPMPSHCYPRRSHCQVNRSLSKPDMSRRSLPQCLRVSVQLTLGAQGKWRIGWRMRVSSPPPLHWGMPWLRLWQWDAP